MVEFCYLFGFWLKAVCCMVSWVSLALDIEGHSTKNNFYCFLNSVPKFYTGQDLYLRNCFFYVTS